MLDRIDVSFAVPFTYPVVFSDGLFEVENRTLIDTLAASGESSSVLVFVDDALAASDERLLDRIRDYFLSYVGQTKLAGPLCIVPGGEAAKQGTATFDRAVAALRSARLDRHGYAVIIGGGAVLDAVGFAASVVHRGVRQVRVPTTVLAQNDAGIGVKNGIDFGGTKNGLGSFAPPHAVLNDFQLLRTLPAVAWRDGIAEAIKVALIRDGDFFKWLEANVRQLADRDESAMRHMIRRCAELHLQQIMSGGDPFERGSARPLDFGHWAAHKLEQLSNFTISHGSAVAAGVAIDSLYSAKAGHITIADAERVIHVLQSLGIPLAIGVAAGLTRETMPTLLAGIEEFQEHLGGRLCLTLLTAIGRGQEFEMIDRKMLQRCCDAVLLEQGSFWRSG